MPNLPAANRQHDATLDLLGRAKAGDSAARRTLIARAAAGDKTCFVVIRRWLEQGCLVGQNLLTIEVLRGRDQHGRDESNLFLEILFRAAQKKQNWAVVALRDLVVEFSRSFTRTLQHADRDDLLQDVTIEILSKLPKLFAGEQPPKLRGLLFTVAQNAARTRLRQSARKVRPGSIAVVDVEDPTFADIADVLADRETSQLAQLLYHDAPREIQEIVFLAVQGQSVRKIAEDLGIPRSTVNDRLRGFRRDVYARLQAQS